MAQKCVYCGHGWSEHHTLADTPTDANGTPNPPKGTATPCDTLTSDGGRCGCTRWWGRASYGTDLAQTLKRLNISIAPEDPPTRHDCTSIAWSAYGNWYWQRRAATNKRLVRDTNHKQHRVDLILLYREFRKRARTAPHERDARGNIIMRGHDADVAIGMGKGETRYAYDFGPFVSGSGWEQYDTRNDASYWGCWVNLQKRQIFTYCEGDRTLVVCDDDDHLRAELADMEAFYGPPPPAMIAYSPNPDGTWTREEAYDKRPTI